ncbi:MAG: polysaccharide deacetylase family protein [Acidimicrobiales bacterium]
MGATVDSYPALTADGALIVGVTDGRLLAIADDRLPCVTARRAAGGASLAYSPSRPDAVVAATTDAPLVGLGVDDGPSARFTPEVLAVLARHRAQATFFVIGQNAAAHPELVADVAAAGHEVAHHTWSHRNLVGRASTEIADELQLTTSSIGRAGVEPRRLLRPPRGEQDEVAAEAVCRAGLRTIGWSTNLERHLDDPEALANRVQPGAIILVHDARGDRTRSIEALDRFLSVLDDRGIRGVGVDELLASGAACGPPRRTTGCGR